MGNERAVAGLDLEVDLPLSRVLSIAIVSSCGKSERGACESGAHFGQLERDERSSTPSLTKPGRAGCVRHSQSPMDGRDAHAYA